MSVSVKPVLMKDGSTRLKLVAPFHPAAPAKLRALGGKWNDISRVWYIDPRDADRLSAVCREIWGVDPLSTEPVEHVTIRVALDKLVRYASTPDIWLVGRQLVRRLGRDHAVQLGDGVVVAAGEFTDRGGSARYPEVGTVTGVVLEVRDVPRALAEAAIAAHPDAIEVIETPDPAVALAAAAAAYAAKTTATTDSAPAADNPVERAWAAVQALDEAGQVEIRNRLLQLM